MPMNPVLKRDVEAIAQAEGKDYMPPRMKALGPEGKTIFDFTANELKQTFEIYGIEWSEEAVQTAMATMIWTASATLDMFKDDKGRITSPTAPENDNPLGHALHPQMASFEIFRYILLQHFNQAEQEA